ncbi:TetR/AcrR family transcriptional regulator [Brevibacterium renqingii]|uniref:TetR/AcrR family transcriptional regulator n=1 Tax=Brevibacterium renqingii TaxID=2776916 RepID=UPI001AE0300D|nr:TetR/AcrR family transcriptional regulator [Brevibacterium renqingii]
MTDTTPRQRARLETEAQITAIGNRMVDEDGIEGVSLRAIARELGVVSSAVYRYVRNRDELLTILIRDAFDQIADFVDEALAKERSVAVLALAMLEWSRGHPNRWALIYGTPIADYEAPREETVVPGTRIMVALAQLVADSTGGGEGPTPEPLPAAAALQPLREGLAELGLEYEGAVIMSTVTIWVAVIGLVNALRFGQFGPGLDGVEDELMRGVISSLGE